MFVNWDTHEERGFACQASKMMENRFFFLRIWRTLGGFFSAEQTWITEQACEGVCSLVTLEIGV